jgi:hypothetical protein
VFDQVLLHFRQRERLLERQPDEYRTSEEVVRIASDPTHQYAIRGEAP